MKRILSVLTVICCLAGGLGPLRAFAAPDETSETNPRIVFTNEPVEAADLYVKKELVSADPDYAVPEDKKDAVFGFTLKLNGVPARSIVYHLYNGSVSPENEIFNGESGGIQNKFRTGTNGSFQLKAGQTAVFKSEDNPTLLREGTSYSVEEDTPNGRYRLSESVDTEGSIGKNGAMARFVNEYLPEGTGEEAVLYVSKTVSFPAGYEVPETPDFQFQLKLNNQVCGNASYDIMNGREVTGTGETDENGIFTLKGGETVCFRSYNGSPIRTGMQYEVREVNLPEGWRALGDNAVSKDVTTDIAGEPCEVAALEQGAAEPITRLNFQNITAAFRVIKRVKGDVKPDQDFIFELTHGDRTLWKGASYYLYDANRNLISNTEEGTDYFVTDEEGHFALKHGQTAVFYGLGAGEVYNVRELLRLPGEGIEGEPLYIQSVPKNPPDYSDKEVSDHVPEWEFQNIPVEESGLRVTKSVINNTDDTAFKEADFQFTLYQRGEQNADSSWNWTPVKGEDFIRTERGVRSEGKTDSSDGSFTLKADSVIIFPYLEAGYYKVVEDVTKTPEYLVLPDTDPEAEKTKTQEKEGELEENGTLTFSFDNYYTSWKYDLRLVKKDGEGNVLKGAEFKLYWDEARKNPVTAEAEEQSDEESGDSVRQEITFTTDENGIALIEDLKAGTYTLEEAKAPSGYAIIFAPIKLEVVRDAEGIKVLLDDGEADPRVIQCTKTTVSDSNDNDLVEVTIYNTKFYELPSSGGIGIYWYSIGGTLLMLAASLILYKYRRQGRC